MLYVSQVPNVTDDDRLTVIFSQATFKMTKSKWSTGGEGRETCDLPHYRWDWLVDHVRHIGHLCSIWSHQMSEHNLFTPLVKNQHTLLLGYDLSNLDFYFFGDFAVQQAIHTYCISIIRKWPTILTKLKTKWKMETHPWPAFCNLHEIIKWMNVKCENVQFANFMKFIK